MKNSVLFFILFSCCFFGCSDDDSNNYPLENTGILGEWEISMRGIDNTSTAEIVCCESLIFSDNDTKNDLIGYYTYIYSGENYGSFNLDTDNTTITFASENGNINTETYLITENTLELWYYENEHRHWEIYTKVIEE
ncbi:hypothetical protein [Winogradskyella endarachnes]|uniref:Lipocalin-like domain-containing protein n=1 Tax=Winogradskyella endarachnes TaxID=2681965 RepID=A0A6L6U649_9FLAO|nr:hypothetical protein [Winogradskyella endarachnes]MUU77389.1 hypothetical protein [Winogradskyella endarachnes]